LSRRDYLERCLRPQPLCSISPGRCDAGCLAAERRASSGCRRFAAYGQTLRGCVDAAPSSRAPVVPVRVAARPGRSSHCATPAPASQNHARLAAASWFDLGITLGGARRGCPCDFFRTSRCSRRLRVLLRQRFDEDCILDALRFGQRPRPPAGRPAVLFAPIQQWRADPEPYAATLCTEAISATSPAPLLDSAVLVALPLAASASAFSWVPSFEPKPVSGQFRGNSAGPLRARRSVSATERKRALVDCFTNEHFGHPKDLSPTAHLLIGCDNRPSSDADFATTGLF